MTTTATISHLLKTCENICSYYAMQDYLKANTDKNGRQYKRYHPYALGDETLEAKQAVDLCHKAACDGQMDRKTEEVIKGYIMKICFINPVAIKGVK